MFLKKRTESSEPPFPICQAGKTVIYSIALSLSGDPLKASKLLDSTVHDWSDEPINSYTLYRITLDIQERLQNVDS